jgi:hypothetical protein
MACIAGGALAGAAVTAGVMARGGDAEYRVVTRHCAVEVEAPRVVIRLKSGDGESTVTTRSYARTGASDGPCVSASSIAVIRTAEWREDIGEQLDAARARMEEVRLEADEMRLHADELRLEADQFRLQADELRLDAEQEAMRGMLKELLAELKGSEASAEEIGEAMRQMNELTLARRAKPVVRIYRPDPPAAPDAPAAPAPAPAAPGSGGN